MSKSETKIKEAHRKVKKYIDILDAKGLNSKEAADFYKKHKNNEWFAVLANLSRGVTEALQAGKKVEVVLRKGKKSSKPKLTRQVIHMPSAASRN